MGLNEMPDETVRDDREEEAPRVECFGLDLGHLFSLLWIFSLVRVLKDSLENIQGAVGGNNGGEN